jgi:hypothetical protein
MPSSGFREIRYENRLWSFFLKNLIHDIAKIRFIFIEK